MSKKTKIILSTFVLIIVIAIFLFNYVMHGGKRNIATEKTDFKIVSKVISEDFIANTELANKKYLEKVIEISGKITTITDSTATIDNNVLCIFKKDQKVIVKGRVVGYDDLMGELKIDNCFLIEK
jgi:hypothetical protein